MIKGTVALPVWNSVSIIWLCLESLCRQNKPQFGWELIIFEEKQSNQVGEKYIRSFEKRLQEVGCERIKYLTAFDRQPLSMKWVKIAQQASPTSQYFCLCAADNYYHSYMLRDSEEAIKKYDWFIVNQGFFYDFKIRKIIRYYSPGMVGLQMTARTDLVRNMPLEIKRIGVDGWFYKRLKPKKSLKDPSDHWKGTLCTNSLNNVSKSRHTFFTRIRRPFYPCIETLQDIVPTDICEKIIFLSNSLKK